MRSITTFPVVCVLLFAAAATGRTVEHSKNPGWIEIDAGSVSAEASVTWEARKPVTLSYREYITVASGRRVCVLHITRPGQYVMVCDVIDWEARSREKTTHIITVRGGNPDDGGDDDGRVDPIDPIDPDEDDAQPLPPTQYGVGPKVARAFPKQSRVQSAKVFEDVATRLETTRIPVNDAHKLVYEGLRKILGANRMSPHETYKAALSQAWKEERVRGQADTIGAFREIAQWLRR
jgi:hypothetical protein